MKMRESGMMLVLLLAMAGAADAGGKRPPRERPLETDGTGSRSTTPDMGTTPPDTSPTSTEDMKRNDVYLSTTPRQGGTGTGSNGSRRREGNMGDGNGY